MKSLKIRNIKTGIITEINNITEIKSQDLFTHIYYYHNNKIHRYIYNNLAHEIILEVFRN